MRRVLTVLGVLAGLMLTAMSPVLAGDAEVGMVDTSTGRWHLREPNGSDRSFFYGNPGDIPLLGDWDCDGVDTPGMFRPGNGFFYLTNANPPNGGVAVAETSFFFGIAGDRPIAGDWDGDGCDTVGIYRNDKVFLSDKLATGNAYLEFFFGVPGDRPFAGDWDGDGIDTVGIYRNASGQIFYTNENPVGPVATTANDFFYGIPTDQFMPGDWDGNGSDTVGIFRPSETQFYLRNTNSTGPADEQFLFGQSSWAPLGGDLELRGATVNGSPIEFGPVGVNGSRTVSLELSFGGGSGDIDLQIASIEFFGRDGAEFSAPPLADPVIGFGETRTVQVTFAPSSVQVKRGFIHIHHSGAGSPLILSLTGEGSYRVNAGGDPVDDWGADSPFSPGGSIGPLASGSVSGPTAPDEVFESYRFGQQAWDFPVTPGAYRVNLYFAETFPGTQSTGARQFNVDIEGLEVLTNFDIFAAAGADSGILRSFDIISDGNLDIDFTQVVNSPAIQGIEVIPKPVLTSLGASPAEATFGSIAVGDSIFRTIRVVHLGEQSTGVVNLQRATIVGTDSNQFGFISGAAARQLQPGQVSAIVVGYSPSRAGVADARLSIEHDGANSPLEVDLNAAADDVILYRLNAGGDAIVGQFSWSPDDAYLVPGTPSGEFTLVEAINTSDLSLPLGTPLDMIRTERFGSTSQALAYDLPLANGTYEVRFYFVEGVHTAAGVRVFDVNVEGGLALNDLDIFARAGKNKAIMIPVRANVTGGVLDIDLIPIAGKNLPAVHGIEVVEKVGNAVLSSDPVSLTLGPILSSASATGEVEMVHSGGAGIPSIVLDSVVIGGPDAARFSIVGGPTAGAVFPPGASATSEILFAPGSTGDKDANLVVTYNGGSVLSVPLVGSVNDPPVVATPTDESISETASYSRTITATDPDPGDFLTMSASGLPFWASVTSSGDGTITIGGSPGFDDAGSSLITVTATDSDGASDAESFTLTVVNVNRPPAFNQDLGTQTNTEGDTVSISSEATDLDGDDLTWTATGLPPGTFIGSSSGLISGTIPFTAAGSYTVTVTVTDDGVPNLTATDTFLWTIGENLLLTVSKVGSGTVTSVPAGISCGFDCSERYPSGTSVTLTPAPASGWSFAGWSGAGCAGTGPCTVSMSVDVGVTATFSLDPVTLTVTKAGTGAGTVTSAPAGISCGGDCVGDYLPGTSVTLTPAPAAGSSFAGWTGAGCAAFGTSPCTVSMSVDIGVVALFSLDPVTLTVSKVGSGTVTSAPAGISCGGDCAGDYLPGTDVTLTPAPASGWSFAGWSGAGCAAAGTGPCTVSMSVDVGVTATFSLDPVTLTVTKAGTGAGTVTSAPAGISCGGDCAGDYLPGTSVTLTPSAATGSSFAGWTGAGCAAFGTSPCTVSMSVDIGVVALFSLDPVTLTVTKAGLGSGTVTSAPAGISCGSDCSEAYVPGTDVTLTAAPVAGSSFVGWTGAGCAGTSPCTISMSVSVGVTATFSLDPVTLTVTKAGLGSGTVTSAPAGISCGGDCSEPYAPGTSVTLTAAPAVGSSFDGWTGAGCVAAGTGPCLIDVSTDLGVTATFTLDPVFFTLTAATSGSGSVSSAPVGISCGGDCTEDYLSGTSVTLTPAPVAGWSFDSWSGACSGSGACVVLMDGAKSVTATFTLDPVFFTLTAATSGSGSVSSAPVGISCGGDCTEDYLSGTSVTLTPAPVAGWSFDSWSGACSGSGACVVLMDGAKSVTATFTLDPVFFTLTAATSGSGSVSSAPVGISCGGDCTEDYLSGTSVTLTPAPVAGWSFDSWSGACSGSGACVVLMDGAKSVTATFTLDPVFFTLTAATSGSGSVSSAPVGISCGGDCTEDYLSGTSVTLTPAPVAGWSFDSWSGACSGSGACVVLMDGAKSVTATFTLDPVFFTLTAATSGSGSVSSAPVGISCGGDCTEDYLSGTSVTLTPAPVAGWSFDSWSGACSGSGACVVLMDGAKSVTATFTLDPVFFTLTAATSGSGSVSSAPVGISCGGDCTEDYLSGTSVTLTPAPVAGWSFDSWSGACSGSGACVVLMDGAKSVTATFTLDPVFFTLTAATSGSGSVSSAPVGISCGGDCTEDYLSGTSVTLTPAPVAGWSFDSWSGACSGSGACVVLMDGAKSVTATFTEDTPPP